MPLPPIDSTDPTDWHYVAEGGANLVLRYMPRDHQPGSVPNQSTAAATELIRVRKRKRDDNMPSSDTGQHGRVPYSEVDSAEFARDVVAKVLGEGGRMLLVEQREERVEASWLDALDGAVSREGKRAVDRSDVDRIDENAGKVVVCQDLIGGQGVVSVEIKPKWGFLPASQQLSEQTRGIKQTYCRYCMHRYMKQGHKHPMQALETHQTGYCPLDLYSGDQERVSRAIRALWSDWKASCGGTNNIRLFVDGRRVEPHDDAGLARLRTLLMSAEQSSDSMSTVEVLVSRLSRILLESPALPELERLQSGLDPYDIEGLSQVEPLGLSAASTISGTQPSLDEWRSWAERIVTEPDPEPSLATLRTNSASLRRALLSFLLSATFKDCSMIVRMEFHDPASGAATPAAQEKRVGPQITVKLIDLDPKPIHKMPHYLALDGQIVKTWQTLLDWRKREGLSEVRRCACD